MKITHAIFSIALGITSVASVLGGSQPASAEPQKAPRVVEIMVHGAFVPDKIAAVEGERLELRLVVTTAAAAPRRSSSRASASARSCRPDSQ
ncbi:hypothetical protein [Sorangium atrum]|uniref:Uncharacterized protein n=1 Tax=Sorangium atrum TaxID=2995308 RepID=A0ABT5CFQ1_9BACT|nr:hypothetical protein [Sorangium aterium]MDC0684473.1 hypothetical protein [Sorangium aterium]